MKGKEQGGEIGVRKRDGMEGKEKGENLVTRKSERKREEGKMREKSS